MIEFREYKIPNNPEKDFDEIFEDFKTSFGSNNEGKSFEEIQKSCEAEAPPKLPIEIAPFNLQKLSIPNTMLYYIKRNSNYWLLKKLQKSSKQLLFFHFSISLCQKIVITEDVASSEFIQDSLYLKDDEIEDCKNLTNIYIADTININTKLSNVLSKLIPKIYKSDIKILLVENQNMTLDELKILLSSGKLEVFKFIGGSLKQSSGEVVHIKDVFELMPNLKSFS